VDTASCIMTFTGWMLLNRFSSEWLQLYTSVCTASLQRTWLNCVCPLLHQQVIMVGFGPPQPATWSYHAADCQPIWHPCFQCRWSSLLLCLTGLLNHQTFFNCFRQQLKHFYFVNNDTSPSTTLAH